MDRPKSIPVLDEHNKEISKAIYHPNGQVEVLGDDTILERFRKPEKEPESKEYEVTITKDKDGNIIQVETKEVPPKKDNRFLGGIVGEPCNPPPFKPIYYDYISRYDNFDQLEKESEEYLKSKENKKI